VWEGGGENYRKENEASVVDGPVCLFETHRKVPESSGPAWKRERALAFGPASVERSKGTTEQFT